MPFSLHEYGENALWNIRKIKAIVSIEIGILYMSNRLENEAHTTQIWVFVVYTKWRVILQK